MRTSRTMSSMRRTCFPVPTEPRSGATSSSPTSPHPASPHIITANQASVVSIGARRRCAWNSPTARATTSRSPIPTSTTSPPSSPPSCPSRPASRRRTHTSAAATHPLHAIGMAELWQRAHGRWRCSPPLPHRAPLSLCLSHSVPRAHAGRRSARTLVQARRQGHAASSSRMLLVFLYYVLSIGGRSLGPSGQGSRSAWRLGCEHHLHVRRL
jgi:hypothetical protein